MPESYHPWQFTVPQLLDYLIREHGDQGWRAATTIRDLAVSIGQSFDEILEPEVLTSLILQAGFRPEDFGLDSSD